MEKITHPADMNEAFARGFNSREIKNLLALYEENALLRVDDTAVTHKGKSQIAEALKNLLNVPGTMVSLNNFCIEFGDIALLRADWEIRGEDGELVVAGSSAEVVHHQPDGSWLYTIDHATGSSLPRVG